MMSDRRINRESGHEGRKRRQEKQRKEEEVIQKTKKLDTFFGRISQAPGINQSKQTIFLVYIFFALLHQFFSTRLQRNR